MHMQHLPIYSEWHLEVPNIVYYSLQFQESVFLLSPIYTLKTESRRGNFPQVTESLQS